MKEIGKKLQAKRRALKLSYNDVSETTKMSQDYIRAIEDGNFDYFKDDITYLRFYVRAYCKAVDIPFEEIKDEYADSMNDYTQTLTLKAIKETEEIEESINARIHPELTGDAPALAKKDRGSIKQNVKQGTKFRKKKKLDVSLISLLAIVVVVIGLLVYVLFNNLLGSSGDEKPKEPEVAQKNPKPEEEKEEPKEKEKEEPVAEAFVSTMVSPTEYNITGLKIGTPIKLEVSAAADVWVNTTLNNAPIPRTDMLPDGPTIKVGTVGLYEWVVSSKDDFVLTLGNVNQTSIKINGKDVVLDPSIGPSGVTLKLNIVGE